MDRNEDLSMNIKLKRNFALYILGMLCGVSSSIVGTQLANATQLQNGLINYWKFNEGTGTTLTDTAPTGISTDSGTLRNSPAWLTGASGKFNAGLQFDGTTQDVLMTTGGDMDFATAGVTLSAWVKLDQLPSVLPGAFGSIFDSVQDNYVLYLDKGNNELRFKATNQAGGSTVGAQHPGVAASLLNTTDWVHVMGVYDAQKGRSMIFYNGQLADISAQAGASQLLANQTIRTGQIASIGAQPNATTLVPSTFFAGKISDVAMWNRPLGLAEAQYLYNGGTGNAVGAANPDIAALPGLSPVKPGAQPVIYYPFDGNLNNAGTGGAAYNAVLHDAVGKNDSLFTSDAPFGQGLDLKENAQTGTSINQANGDYLSVDYQLGNSGTIATRYKINLAGSPILYNFATLWSNSSHENDWESWVYNDGRVAARANRDTAILGTNFQDLPDGGVGSEHIAFSWVRDTVDPTQMTVKMYVNGELIDKRVGVWRDPGTTVFIAGGGSATVHNTLGNGIYDEFRIYTSALTDAEILYLSQNAPAVTALQGDYNLDGKVNGADYVVWRNGGSPDSSQAGYTLWRQNYGTGAGAGAENAAAVPEPMSIGLVLVGLTALSLQARRTRLRQFQIARFAQ